MEGPGQRGPAGELGGVGPPHQCPGPRDVLSGETHPCLREVQCRSGHLAVDEMCVEGHTGAGQGKGGHACYQGDGPGLV